MDHFIHSPHSGNRTRIYVLNATTPAAPIGSGAHAALLFLLLLLQLHRGIQSTMYLKVHFMYLACIYGYLGLLHLQSEASSILCIMTCTILWLLYIVPCT